nr:immunoglobulin heavy chain junction region [Macaca mulatta]
CASGKGYSLSDYW